MIKYRLLTDNGYIEFSELQLLQNYCNENSIENPNYEEITEETNDSDLISKLYKDIDFGNCLINTFLEDNRLMPVAFTLEETKVMLSKFEKIEKLARLGDIKTVKVLIFITETDPIFTQERKDKYLLMINNYLDNN